MIKSLLSSWGISAATAIPTDPAPKVRSKRQALPSYLLTAKPPQTPMPVTDRQLANTDTVPTFAGAGSTSKTLRAMGYMSPEFSSAIFSYLRVGIPNGYVAVAKNPDGSFNPEATQALQQIIARFDVLPDYTQGFNGVASLRSLSESLAKDLLYEGAMCGELVLDKSYLPSRIQPISVYNMRQQPDKDGYLVPVQYIGGSHTVLDAPTIFYVALDQALIDAYPSSPMESAIKAVQFSENFVNDVQRVMKRAVHPRLTVTLDEDKFRKSVPQDIVNDPVKLIAYQNEVVANIQAMINGLQPEDALVYFDMLGIQLMNNGNQSLSHEYTFIQDMANAKMASGAKTMPAVLGMGSGSQNVASTETMLFAKAVSGAITKKLDEFYSRIFTLAVRLLGYDVVAEFTYDPIDLRPESELESFRSVKQARILELLSLGLLTDEEASLQLTGRLPPKGYVPLSGTQFKSAGPAEATDPTSNAGSAANKAIKADSAGVKGQNKKANPQQAAPTKH
jgi:hypothetical protein